MDIERLLPLLSCPHCANADLVLGPDGNARSLTCTVCNSSYPITQDGIPDFMPDDSNAVGDQAALFANIETYDKISDSYAVHTRRGRSISDRIRTAFQLARHEMPEKEQYWHLDIGCGPGRVIDASSGDRRVVHVGLDVSLQNLRNTKRRTGALVVRGDATRVPFKDGAFDIVTESSVLHHVFAWQQALREMCRISAAAVLIDSEPTRDQMDWSVAARFVFDLRWNVYWALSFVDRSKYIFRDVAAAKRNYWEAEVHNQPGKGFEVEEIRRIFDDCGMRAHIVLSPDAQMKSAPTQSWKHWVLHMLSFHNPLDTRYGPLLAYGQRT